MLSSLSTEDLIPVDHPIRRIRVVVDAVLADLDEVFDGMYAAGGRASVPPETLLKATVLMAMYSIRSERAFCERLNYDLLFKWFLDMRIDQPAFDASTFSKNRSRLLGAEVADEFFAAVVRQAKLRRYISSDHFSVDGTLLDSRGRVSDDNVAAVLAALEAGVHVVLITGRSYPFARAVVQGVLPETVSLIVSKAETTSGPTARVIESPSTVLRSSGRVKPCSSADAAASSTSSGKAAA